MKKKIPFERSLKQKRIIKLHQPSVEHRSVANSDINYVLSLKRKAKI